MNVVICLSFPDKLLYQIILLAQILFYLASTAGYFLESRKIKIKILFIPFYFSMMNYAAIAGTFRYFIGNQSAAWEKAKRR